MAKITKGLLYKKVFDEEGNVVEKVPFLTSTLANLVVLQDGKSVQEAIDDINYFEIAITSFTHSMGNQEKGSTLNDVTLKWVTNKTPKILSIDDVEIDAKLKTITLGEQGLTQNKTYKLKAVDDRDYTVEKTTTISFYNGIYYGVGAEITTVTNTFIQTLTKKLQASRVTEFTVTSDSGKYIYFAIPASYGEPTFTVGGFTGGFYKLSTLNYTNPSGFSENYNVYRSVNSDLGTTKVSVS